jgi:hypothetical protein
LKELVVPFLIVWAVLGLAAFVKSITCFAKGGTTTEKSVGLIIAMLFGPFYYLYRPPGYC